MRFDGVSSSLLALVATSLIRPTIAGLVPDILQRLEDLQNINKRCQNPCGYYGQLCCQDGESCYTDSNGQAACGGGGSAATTAANVQNGNWQYYTTTFVQTDLKTVTQTYSSFIPAQTTAAPSGSDCAYSQGETPCGSTCCHSGQYCQQANMCVEVPGGSSGYYSSLYTVTTVVTNTASAPLRPTSNTVVTLTSGGAATTAPFQTPVGTDGAILTGGTQSSSGGLSGGAIAGIVIGVIAGIIILLLICACCCFKGLLDGLLALFGLGPRRRRRTEVIEEERYSHHGRTGGRTWFGMGPRKTEVVEEKRHDSGWKRAGGVAAFLGAVALILGLKRRRDRRDDKTSSSYSYYDSDYYTSSSSSSSGGRRTRGSRSRSRSRVSRGTRL